MLRSSKGRTAGLLLQSDSACDLANASTLLCSIKKSCMVVVVALGKQLVLNKSAFLNIQRLLKYVCVCVRCLSESSERNRASYLFDSPIGKVEYCVY